MNTDKLRTMIEKYVEADEFLEDERISNQTDLKYGCDFAALKKITELLKQGKKINLCAEHDILFICSPEDLVNVTKEDALYLTRCGVIVESETESLATYT